MRHIEKDPEILTQIGEYRNFLKENKDQLLDYYKTLLKIKKNLKLTVPEVDIDKISIDTEPVLLIADYISVNKKQSDRKKDIENVLNTNGVIIEYANNRP